MIFLVSKLALFRRCRVRGVLGAVSGAFEDEFASPRSELSVGDSASLRRIDVRQAGRQTVAIPPYPIFARTRLDGLSASARGYKHGSTALVDNSHTRPLSFSLPTNISSYACKERKWPLRIHGV